MLRREMISHLLHAGATSAVAVSLGGCATMLHPERLNQPHSHNLDWKMVALNGLGLIFFFVPGVIAFVVDFHTGAIYLPPHAYAYKPPMLEAESSVTLKKVAVPTGAFNLATVEREVTAYTGQTITLSETSSRATKLDRLDQFAQVQQRHQADRSFGVSPKHLLQRWLPHLKLG